jgi:hypothetical protein
MQAFRPHSITVEQKAASRGFTGSARRRARPHQVVFAAVLRCARQMERLPSPLDIPLPHKPQIPGLVCRWLCPLTEAPADRFPGIAVCMQGRVPVRLTAVPAAHSAIVSCTVKTSCYRFESTTGGLFSLVCYLRYCPIWLIPSHFAISPVGVV